MKIQSRGFEITTEELRADVEAAKNKGPYWASAFCLETVEALLDLLDLYAQQNQDNAEENKKLREANRKQGERISVITRSGSNGMGFRSSGTFISRTSAPFRRPRRSPSSC